MSCFEALRIVVATVPLATVAVAQDTQRVSEAADGTPSDAPTRFPSIASDGRSVVFATQSDNLVPGVSGTVEQVYLEDMVSGVVTLVSADALGNPGDRFSRNPGSARTAPRSSSRARRRTSRTRTPTRRSTSSCATSWRARRPT
jgi:hypothetical protein